MVETDFDRIGWMACDTGQVRGRESCPLSRRGMHRGVVSRAFPISRATRAAKAVFFSGSLLDRCECLSSSGWLGNFRWHERRGGIRRENAGAIREADVRPAGMATEETIGNNGLDYAAAKSQVSVRRCTPQLRSSSASRDGECRSCAAALPRTCQEQGESPGESAATANRVGGLVQSSTASARSESGGLRISLWPLFGG